MNKVSSKKLVYTFVIAMTLSFGVASFESELFSNQAIANTTKIQPLQGRIVSIPAGTSIPLTTTMELSSEYLVLGQNVSFTLSNNFYYNNAIYRYYDVGNK